MLPSPRLFRSRWSALLWAGGIVWMAIDVADSAPTPAPSAPALPGSAAAPTVGDAAGDPLTAADLATIANAIGD